MVGGPPLLRRRGQSGRLGVGIYTSSGMTATVRAPESRVVDTSLSRFVGPVIRSWPVVVLGLVCGLALGAFIPSVRPIGYTATVEVLLRPVVADPVTNQRADQLVSLDTEAAVIGSDEVLTRASQVTGHTLADLRRNLKVVAVPSSQVLRVSETRTLFREARRAADAVTAAYLQQRQERARELVAKESTSISGQIAEADATLNDLSAKLAASAPGSPERVSLQSLLTSEAQQLTNLQNRSLALQRTQIDSGTILRGADKATMSGFGHSTTVPAGGLIGLLAGVAGTVLLDGLSRTVRRSGDVVRVTGHRILAVVADQRIEPRREPDDTEEPDAKAYRRALFALDPHEHAVVAVIGSGGGEASPVSSGLATVAARGGSDIALLRLHAGGVDENIPQVTALDRVLERPSPDSIPFVELGRGRLTVYSLDESVEVLATPLALSGAAARLRAAHDLVVVEIGNPLGSAWAAGWIRAANLSVVAVRLRSTRSGDLRAAVDSLEDASRPPCGSIVLD